MRMARQLSLVGFLLATATGTLAAQAPVGPPTQQVQLALARPLPPALAVGTSRQAWWAPADSARRRPFFLPREGEHTAYWVGLGAGLALSPLLWCDGCSDVQNASTRLVRAGWDRECLAAHTDILIAEARCAGGLTQICGDGPPLRSGRHLTPLRNPPPRTSLPMGPP
jgi:hypothetical protein